MYSTLAAQSLSLPQHIMKYGSPPDSYKTHQALVFNGSNLEVDTDQLVGPEFRAAEYIAYDWRVNGNSIALLHVPMQGGGEDISSWNRTLTVTGSPVHSTIGGWAPLRMYEFDGDDYFDYGTWNWQSGAGQADEITIVAYCSVTAAASTGSVIVGQSAFATHATPFYQWLLYWPNETNDQIRMGVDD